MFSAGVAWGLNAERRRGERSWPKRGPFRRARRMIALSRRKRGSLGGGGFTRTIDGVRSWDRPADGESMPPCLSNHAGTTPAENNAALDRIEIRRRGLPSSSFPYSLCENVPCDCRREKMEREQRKRHADQLPADWVEILSTGDRPRNSYAEPARCRGRASQRRSGCNGPRHQLEVIRFAADGVRDIRLRVPDHLCWLRGAEPRTRRDLGCQKAPANKLSHRAARSRRSPSTSRRLARWVGRQPWRQCSGRWEVRGLE